MIALPPGCRVNYSVWIDIDLLSTDIVDWYELIGGRVKEDTFWNSRGQEKNIKYVAYGRGKWCHHHQNGAGGTRLHFLGEDASVASMFILKFNECTMNHNLKEVGELHY
jgi:hypothetical protein